MGNSDQASLRIGDFIIEKIQFCMTDGNTAHMVFQIRSLSDTVFFLSSLELSPDEEKRIPLLSHQTFPPGSTLMVYRKNLPVSTEDHVIFFLVANNQTMASEPVPAELYFSADGSNVLEETFGSEEFTRFLGRTY